MVRDQDRDRCERAETKTETAITKKKGLETYSPARGSTGLLKLGPHKNIVTEKDLYRGKVVKKAFF